MNSLSRVILLTSLLSIVAVLSSNDISNVIAQTNDTANTFSDPKSGIFLQYPADWRVASEEYVNDIFSSFPTDAQLGTTMPGTVKPIVVVLPESLSGSMFGILSETLPFEMSIDKYFENAKRSILVDPSASVSDPEPVSVDGIDGVKYTVSYDDLGFSQNQIAFIKDGKGYGIMTQAIPPNQIKEQNDLDSILKSLKINSIEN
jgi:hypothetical protein